MGSLVAIPLVGFLGILFVIFNLVILILCISTVVIGIIRFIKKKFKKTFIILLSLTVILGFIDYRIIDEFANYDEFQRRELIKEEGKELVAIRDNKYDKIEEYLKNGWDPNETTKALYYAIKYNSDENKTKDKWEILELLLKNGTNPDVQIFENPKGVNTPLTYTTECGYYEATKLLLEYGADPNYQESDMKKNGLLALRFYENENAKETLQLLLDSGTDLSISDITGKTGLEELKSFKNNYANIKEKVPHYDEIIEIIERTLNSDYGKEANKDLYSVIE